MRIRLITGRAGDGFVQEPGQVLDLPEAEARRLVEHMQAEPVSEEATEHPATEQATHRPRRQTR